MRNHPMEPVWRVLSNFLGLGDQGNLVSSNFCKWTSIRRNLGHNEDATPHCLIQNSISYMKIYMSRSLLATYRNTRLPGCRRCHSYSLATGGWLADCCCAQRCYCIFIIDAYPTLADMHSVAHRDPNLPPTGASTTHGILIPWVVLATPR